jgi:chemotaxis protein histidine kinase CheA
MGKAKRWNSGKKKPNISYRFIKGVGLVVVFPSYSGNGHSFVVDGQFHGPFPTQEHAQHEAQRFAAPAPADSPGDEEENTSMEPNSNAAQQQETPQYVTKAKYDRLVAYVQELVTEHNRLDARVAELERHEENRQPELTNAIRHVHEASLCFQDALGNSAAAEVKAQ